MQTHLAQLKTQKQLNASKCSHNFAAKLYDIRINSIYIDILYLAKLNTYFKHGYRSCHVFLFIVTIITTEQFFPLIQCYFQKERDTRSLTFQL